MSMSKSSFNRSLTQAKNNNNHINCINTNLATYSSTNRTQVAKTKTKNTLADTAILSLADFERIKKNAAVLSKEEELNNQRLMEEQKELKLAEAHVNLIKIGQTSKNYRYR